MNKQDGGPAFPTGGAFTHRDGTLMEVAFRDGMSLRDYFAAAALTGAMTTSSGLGTVPKEQRSKALVEMAEILYEVADAMLKARDK